MDNRDYGAGFRKDTVWLDNSTGSNNLFSIPESTIWSWKTKKVTSKRLGAPTALSPEEETALVNWYLKMQDVACCMSLKMLKTKVKKLCANHVTRFR